MSDKIEAAIAAISSYHKHMVSGGQLRYTNQAHIPVIIHVLRLTLSPTPPAFKLMTKTFGFCE